VWSASLYWGLGAEPPAGFRGRAKSYTGWAKKPERGFEDECGRELGLQYRVGQKSKLLYCDRYFKG